MGDDGVVSRWRAVLSASLWEKVSEAMRSVEGALAAGGEGEVLAFSFNGGKDCTVLLHLLDGIASKRGCALSDLVFSFYIAIDDEFPEVLSFIQDMDKRYSMNMCTIKKDFKSALQDVLDEHPVRHVLLGTRRTDPYSLGLQPFQETDPGWPSCTRVHPILDWTYADVWEFLIRCDVPYCQLYDHGYTSLGCIHDTQPNPALQREDGSYRPAHELEDGSLERNGRRKKERLPASSSSSSSSSSSPSSSSSAAATSTPSSSS